MPNTPDISAFESARVLTRFFLRLIILSVFAGLSYQGFGKTLVSLLLFAVLFCIVAGTVLREHPFGLLLSHFDEAAAYGVVACLVARAS